MNAIVRAMRASCFQLAETGAYGDTVPGRGLGEQSALVEQPGDMQPATRSGCEGGSGAPVDDKHRTPRVRRDGARHAAEENA